MSTYSTKYFPDSNTKFSAKVSASGGGGGGGGGAGSGANTLLTARWIPITCIPRLPSRCFKQKSSDFEVIQRIQQIFLFTKPKFGARNSVLVTA